MELSLEELAEFGYGREAERILDEGIIRCISKNLGSDSLGKKWPASSYLFSSTLTPPSPWSVQQSLAGKGHHHNRCEEPSTSGPIVKWISFSVKLEDCCKFLSHSPCFWDLCHWLISCPGFPLPHAGPWKSWSAWGMVGSSPHIPIIPSQLLLLSSSRKQLS